MTINKFKYQFYILAISIVFVGGFSLYSPIEKTPEQPVFTLNPDTDRTYHYYVESKISAYNNLYIEAESQIQFENVSDNRYRITEEITFLNMFLIWDKELLFSLDVPFRDNEKVKMLQNFLNNTKMRRTIDKDGNTVDQRYISTIKNSPYLNSSDKELFQLLIRNILTNKQYAYLNKPLKEGSTFSHRKTIAVPRAPGGNISIRFNYKIFKIFDEFTLINYRLYVDWCG